MILSLFQSFLKLNSVSFQNRYDDDVLDRLSRKYSAILLIIFSTIATTNQLVGKSVSCWCPKELKGKKCSYGTTTCYITNFYAPSTNTTQLDKREDLMSHKIYYYQWVPYIFLFQAFLFYLPYVLW